MNMKKRIIAYCLIIVELIIQILSGLYYENICPYYHEV